LLVGPGSYNEPGEPAWINPGVTVIGSGWDFFAGTVLYQIELFFVAGADSAVVQDLKIAHAHVSSDNSLGVVRRCLFGNGIPGPFFDGYLAYVRGGLIMEDCFINCQLVREPFIYLYVQGGSFLMRNCVVSIPFTHAMMDIHDIGPYPIVSVDVHDNTFFAEGAMSFFIDGSAPIPGPVSFVNNIFQTQPGGLAFNCGSGASISREYNAFSTAPIGCGPPSNTNITVDPLMCDPHYEWPDAPTPEDFELHQDSPCVGAGFNGTTIGALEVGCGFTTAVQGNANPSLSELRIDVSPNPLVRGGSLVIDSQDPGPAILRLYDSAGRLAVQRVVSVRRGGGALDLDRELGVSMSRGVHYLEITQGANRAVRKVVVLP
jgi:hypothetical protein